MSVKCVQWDRGRQEHQWVNAIHVPPANLRTTVRIATTVCQEHSQLEARMNVRLVARERFPEEGQLNAPPAKMDDMPIT